MPLFRYQCTSDKCNKTFSALKKGTEEVFSSVECKFCKAEAKRVLSAPNSSSKISIDNGVQARAVEVDPNIMELREDWTKPPNRGD